VTFAYRDLTESGSRSVDIENTERFQRGSMNIRNNFIDRMLDDIKVNGVIQVKGDVTGWRRNAFKNIRFALIEKGLREILLW
jgi:hypothetical protein